MRRGRGGEKKLKLIMGTWGVVEAYPEANFKSNSNISHHGNEHDLLLLNLDIQSSFLFPF